MKNKAYLTIVIILLVSIIINFASYHFANALSQNIEVLYDDIDDKPSTAYLGETGINESKIELWHFSGGYWKYNDLVITDIELKNDLSDEESLALKLNKEVTFEISLDQNLVNKLKEYENLKVVCSSNLKTQKTSEIIPLSNLFSDRPTIELKNNKIYFKAKPKLHFYKKYRYQEIIGDKFKVIVPIVDPDFGYNSYSIFKRTESSNLGATASYFDKSDPYANAPEGSNLIAPGQIKNADGHLYDGFTYKTGEKIRQSNNTSIGYYTFRNGGAVGIIFKYPIKFTFYGDEYPSDLSAHFETLPSSIVKGQNVQVCVTVKSNFESDLENVPFKWEITKADGTALQASDGLKYSGTSELPEGKISIPSAIQQAVLYADFVMPDSDVKIKFSVNKEGNAPIEAYLDNNSIDSGESIKLVKGVSYKGEFDLDYNVLSRKIKFPLINGEGIRAELILPRGEWDGNAVGELDVRNSTKDIYHDFWALGTDVNEWNDTIVVKPTINATLKRVDFGDNPQGNKYLNLVDPLKPLQKIGEATFGGSVKRSYIYKYNTYKKMPDGSIYSEEHTGTSTTSASFNSGPDTREIKAFIYNGREKMPNIAARNFKNKVDSTGWKSDLFWTSDPYKFDVIRIMCSIDTDNKPYNWTKVDGQYKRTFTQQNTANINWTVKNSMANLYKYDRENARKMNYGKAFYPNVVFASDRGLQKYDWPIKSGYYLNPLGEYTCTLKTVQYKNVRGTTKEHTELVNKIKNSFHYTSNMQYTSDGKTHQSLDLHNGNDKIFGMDMLNITSNYGINETKLEHYDKSEDAEKTHQYFKEILEGYSESNTLASKDNFKYREYIKQGDIYKIEETTVITFTVAPPSKDQKLYTYINMKDGEYRINVRADNLKLENYAYNGLNVSGLPSIDNITVNVNGTLYDDQNSVIGH